MPKMHKANSPKVRIVNMKQTSKSDYFREHNEAVKQLH